MSSKHCMPINIMSSSQRARPLLRVATVAGCWAFAWPLIFLLLAVIVMAISPDLADAFGDLIKDIFGRRQSRTVGKVVVLIPFLVFLPLVHFTLGTRSGYDRIIKEFESLSADQQKQTSKKGLVFAIVSFANIFVGGSPGFAIFLPEYPCQHGYANTHWPVFMISGFQGIFE